MHLKVRLASPYRLDRLFLRTDSGEYSFTILRIGVLRDRWALVSGHCPGQAPGGEILHVRETLEDLLAISRDYIEVGEDDLG